MNRVAMPKLPSFQYLGFQSPQMHQNLFKSHGDFICKFINYFGEFLQHLLFAIKCPKWASRGDDEKDNMQGKKLDNIFLQLS